MPFYEYECAKCKFYTEVMQKIADAPLEKCPSCGKKALKKLVSAPVFRLKGGGWYETDFKSDKEGKRNIADRDEPAAKSEETKAGETKPAAAAAELGGKSTADAGGGSAQSAGQAKGSGESQGGKHGQSHDQGGAGARPGTRPGMRPGMRKGGASATAAAGRGKPAARSHSKPASKGRAKSPGRKKKGRR